MIEKNVAYELWFDVGIKRYTTFAMHLSSEKMLWFDVGIKRYTTKYYCKHERYSCGLM